MASPSDSLTTPGHREIPLSQIESNENVRTHFDADKLKQLAKSIKEQSILQPLIVRPHPVKKNKFQIAAGERRWRAAKLAGLGEAPCIVRELTDDQVEEIQLIENDQREDLKPLERAAGYQKLLDHGYTPEKLALRLGRSLSFVYSSLKLLALPPVGREALDRGEISASTAELIARIPNAELKEKAAREIAGGNFTGAPFSQRLAQEHIARHYMRELKSAPFDPADAKLTKAGSCEACPKRTGNNRRDFPEGRADVCTDPSCFIEKVAAAAKAAPAPPKPQPAAKAETTSPTPAKPADDMRARFSEGKRKRASELAQRLMFLQADFTEPEFNEILTIAVTAAQRLAQSSRQSDRDLLIHILEKWDVLEIEEIVEETGLSRWVAENNLKDLEKKKLVKIQTKDDPKKSGGRPRLIYSLTHSYI